MVKIYFICPHCNALVPVDDSLLYDGIDVGCEECSGKVCETVRPKEFWGKNGSDHDGEDIPGGGDDL